MADQKEPSAAKKFFMQHGEKVALGVAAALLVGYLVYAFALTEQDATARTLSGLTGEIKGQQEREHADLAAGKASSLTSSALAPYTNTSKAEEANAWATAYATVGDVTPKWTEGPVAAKEIVLPAITIETKVNVELKGITVNFSPAAVDKDVDEAVIDSFIVERKGKSGKWDIIDGAVDGKATSFTDSKLDPKTVYSYRITAVTSDPKWKKNNSPDGHGKASNEVSATSLGIWEFSITTASPGRDDEEPGTAFLVIKKFDKDHGMVEVKHNHKAGEKIGVWEETKGKGDTGVHRISQSGGTSIEVDFGSGAELKKVENFSKDVKFKKCIPIFDKSTGTKTGCDTVEDKRKVSGVLVVIKDEEGKTVTIHRPELFVEDQLCEKHGGRKTGGNETSEEKEKKAKDLLLIADKEYETDKKKAAASYKKLLADYGKTEIVKKDLKKIEERSK